MENGYIQLQRSLRDGALWKVRPFSPGQAIVDLSFRAAFRAHDVIFQGQLVKLERRQLVTSQRKLSVDWGWSRNRVKSFLLLLQQCAMVATTDGPGCMIVTLLESWPCLFDESEVGREGTGGATARGPRKGRRRAGHEPPMSQPRATREEGEEGEEGEEPKQVLVGLRDLAARKNIIASPTTLENYLRGWLERVGPETVASMISESPGRTVLEIQHRYFPLTRAGAAVLDRVAEELEEEERGGGKAEADRR